MHRKRYVLGHGCGRVTNTSRMTLHFFRPNIPTPNLLLPGVKTGLGASSPEIYTNWNEHSPKGKEYFKNPFLGAILVLGRVITLNDNHRFGCPSPSSNLSLLVITHWYLSALGMVFRGPVMPPQISVFRSLTWSPNPKWRFGRWCSFSIGWFLGEPF